MVISSARRNACNEDMSAGCRSSAVMVTRSRSLAISTISLDGKYRKKVLGDTSAASAICSTVVLAYPFSSMSRMASRRMASRVWIFLRSRRPRTRLLTPMGPL